ncbi:MAG: hypothetical protein K1X61_15030 [Chitinophagales bacterium]|nr:hypothetical protein [Chitinophagales bacterium]
MKKFFSVCVILSAIFSGCAKIPVESVQLSDAILREGTRMHSINIAVINELFSEKKKSVSDFIEQDYLPEYVKDFTSGLTIKNYDADSLQQILLAILPEINQRRDAMIQALDDQKTKLISQLNNEYDAYYDASNALHALLQSAADVDAERAALNERIRQLSGEKIDLNKVEHSLDAFIAKAGSAGSIDNAISELDNTMNEILNTNK